MEDKENLAFLDKRKSCEHLKDIFQSIGKFHAQCIKKILLGVSNEQIRDGGLGLTPGWDSLAQIQILLEVEKQFKLKFSSSDYEVLKTYNGIFSALVQTDRA